MPAPDEEGACSAYCETSLTYKYGPELPFAGSKCSTNECHIAKGSSVSTTYTWEINLEVGIESGAGALTGAFNIGASYSFSTSLTHSLDQEQVTDLEDGECGYWTWVPYLVE